MSARDPEPFAWHVDVEGVRLLGRVHPVADERATLLLVHGFGDHSGRHQRTVDLLRGLGISVVTYDLRGHGVSPGPRARIPVSRHVRDNLAVRVALRQLRRQGYPGAVPAGPTTGRGATGMTPALLMGHSMGGLIAAESAVRAPFELDGLILSSPALIVDQNAPAVARALAPVVARVAPRLPVERIDATAISRLPGVVSAYETDPLVHHGPVPAAAGGSMAADGRRMLRRGRELRTPTLLLHGTADRVTSIEGSRILAREAGAGVDPRPEVELREFAGGHHELFNDECADAFYDALRDWLERRLA